MPIRPTESGQTLLRCINHDAIPHAHEMRDGTTMRVLQNWNIIYAVSAPAEGDPSPAAHPNPMRGLPIRCYVCAVCGYVEMYHAPSVNPHVWQAWKEG